VLDTGYHALDIPRRASRNNSVFSRPLSFLGNASFTRKWSATQIAIKWSAVTLSDSETAKSAQRTLSDALLC